LAPSETVVMYSAIGTKVDLGRYTNRANIGP
jgi:hypothetical protein